MKWTDVQDAINAFFSFIGHCILLIVFFVGVYVILSVLGSAFN